MGSSIKFVIFSALFFFDVLSACQDGECRQLVFPQFFFVANKRLVNHTIKTVKVQDMDYCEWMCYKEPDCVSVNFEIGTRQCDLNNATHRNHGAELEDEDGFLYHGADSACETNHCQNGGVCQSGYTDKGYRCVCPPGFTSDQCEKAKSCKYIKHNNGSGKYWIHPTSSGAPLQVFCDMTTYGGGWLLVSKVVMEDSTPPTQAPKKTSYRGIASNQMLLSKTAMNELRALINFTQLRFHCKKNNPGRTFHITTAANNAGEAVVQYFSGQTDVMPRSCGSFVKMNDDDSKLAENCDEWGIEHGPFTVNVGKWGHPRLSEDRLYDHSVFVFGKNHWLLRYEGHTNGRFECDDHKANGNNYVLSAGDFWEIYVR